MEDPMSKRTRKVKLVQHEDEGPKGYGRQSLQSDLSLSVSS